MQKNLNKPTKVDSNSPEWHLMLTENMEKENFFDTRMMLVWLKRVWYHAFWPLAAAFFGFLIGSIDAESRIVSDCKYAQAFRVSQQAFNCQRKI